jgi:hypothetical protein
MNPRGELLKALDAEPHKSFTTTILVEAVYPQQMRSIREQLQFGTPQQKRASQLFKSKLHRNILYYLNKLVEEGMLEIARIDAHGEKVYRKQRRGTDVTAETPFRAPKTHFIEDDLEQQRIFFLDEQNVLARFDAFYINCRRLEGLGQLLRIVDIALRTVHDTVCIGELQVLLGKYQKEDLQEFINTLILQTLDEARRVCITLDTRESDVSVFTRLIAEILPKRVNLVLICDQKSIFRKDTLACIAALQERNEKVNIHYPALHAAPLFIGRGGVYGIEEDDWKAYKNDPQQPVGFIVGQVSATLDMQRVAKLPPHHVRTLILNTAKTLYALASQQRTLHTGVQQLQAMDENIHLFFQYSAVYVRIWNYNWEEKPLILQSVTDELKTLTHTQQTIYRACGLPFHFNVHLSSAFNKYAKQLSSRQYKKYSVSSSRDLESSAFREYMEQRLTYLRLFNSIDRFRVFRTGNPTAEQIAQEVIRIGTYGFPLITIDFQRLHAVRKLTDYLPS